MFAPLLQNVNREFDGRLREKKVNWQMFVWEIKELKHLFQVVILEIIQTSYRFNRIILIYLTEGKTKQPHTRNN